MADYLGFLISQVHHVETRAYKVKYPDIQYRRLVPVDTSASEWARGVTHFSMDMTGTAAPLAGRATDLPLADVTRTKHEVDVEMAGIGYDYTIEELGQAMMVPGTNLRFERAAAAIRASEEYIDDKVINGDADHGWDSLISGTNVTAADAPPGAGGNTDWDNKDAEEIFADVNNILTGLWTASRTVEMADTLGLPPKAWSLLANRPYRDMNLMEWIKRYNLTTAQTGRPLMISVIRGLEVAGGSGTGRAIAYKRDPEVLKLHLPMPHRFGDPEKWLLRYIVPGYFRLGGLEIRRPNAVRYLDGIVA